MSPDIEFEAPERIKAFQEEKLQEALRYLAAHSPYYQRVFAHYNIRPEQIRYIEDLVKIPFTTKKDVQLYNEEFLCVPRREIIDYVTTSGTLGDPVLFGLTDHDLDRLAFNEFKSFSCAGLTPDDSVQIMTTLDKRFMAGIAYFLGLRKLGCGIIRVGSGIPELQWDSILRFRPTAIMCVPSFILRLIQYAEEHGIDYRASSVRKIIGIGEGLRDQDFELNLLGRKIKEKWDVELYASYSSTETAATFAECAYGRGGHLHPELLIVEIIGEDDMPVPDGAYGEVVVTTLGIEGMPLLRYRMGDIAAKRTEQCPCGRWSYRLTPLVGRKNNLLKFKGTSIYPPAIYDVLDNSDFVQNYIVYVQESEAGTDDVFVKVGLKYAPDGDPVKILKDHFRSRLRVAPGVVIAPVEEVQVLNYPAKSRKPIKFIDLRSHGA